MTPSEYFVSFVQGNLDDCHTNPGCVRRAFNAAVAASHLADHYFAYNYRHNRRVVASYPTIGPFIAYLESQTGGAFRDLRSISNAYKHLYTDTDPRKASKSNVNSSGSIGFVVLSYDQDVSEISENYLDQRSAVIFRRKDGSTSEFLPVLEGFVDFWHERFYDNS